MSGKKKIYKSEYFFIFSILIFSFNFFSALSKNKNFFKLKKYEMNKEQFFKEKLENFSKFVESEIGKDNEIFADIQKYKANLNNFIQDLISLIKLSGNSIITTDNINKYLELKKVEKFISEEAIDKLHRYLNMFIDILNT